MLPEILKKIKIKVSWGRIIFAYVGSILGSLILFLGLFPHAVAGHAPNGWLKYAPSIGMTLSLIFFDLIKKIRLKIIVLRAILSFLIPPILVIALFLICSLVGEFGLHIGIVALLPIILIPGFVAIVTNISFDR